MEKLSNDQAYDIGVKLAMIDLGLLDEKRAQVPPAVAAGGPAMAAPATQMAQPAPAIPQGMQPTQGAAPGSYENPQWAQQAMPSAPPMKPVLRIPS